MSWFENHGHGVHDWGYGGADAPIFFDIPDVDWVVRMVNDLRRR